MEEETMKSPKQSPVWLPSVLSRQGGDQQPSRSRSSEGHPRWRRRIFRSLLATQDQKEDMKGFLEKQKLKMKMVKLIILRHPSVAKNSKMMAPTW